MELQSQELDIIDFNNKFEEMDIPYYREKEIDPIYEYQNKYNDEKNTIENMILKLRLAFDFILNKLLNRQNPIDEILNDNELLQGTIYLLFFICTLTLLLAGLMKD